MKISEVVKISEFFRRSTNIQGDLCNTEFLKGFICPKSSEDVLLNMLEHITRSDQASFTWTGPYGAGKSSLAVMLASLFSAEEELRELALSKLTAAGSSAFRDFIKYNTFNVVPVIGEPTSALTVIGNALKATGQCVEAPKSTADLLQVLEKATKGDERLILLIDEMGKFLEASSNQEDYYDIYLFQQIAELANASKGSLILTGILHQSFHEYARSLSRDMFDEWSKIQGRFVDFHINAAGEEQLDLISRAILSKNKPQKTSLAAQKVTEIVEKNRPIDSNNYARLLDSCWPLHPAVAALLGPVSKKRFGQNQRSIFSFLNSSEPFGFRQFLRESDLSAHSFYYPYDYWDYIFTNLESSIAASSDSKLWAVATESLARCEAQGGTSEHIRLLKTICLIDVFKGNSGVAASLSLFETCDFKSNIDELINDLIKWSLIRFKKYSHSYSVFEGSDFDLEVAIKEAIPHVELGDFAKLREVASFKPIVAKRHYHMTGALRWMDVGVIPANKASEHIRKTASSSRAIGGFFILIPDNKDEYRNALKTISQRQNVSFTKPYAAICGIASNHGGITSFSQELLALEWIENNRTEMLEGDTIARREVETRKAQITLQLEELLSKQLNLVVWYKDGEKYGTLSGRQLTELTSSVADEVFVSAPIVKNEMLNRERPSGNANAALKSLLRSLLSSEGKERLGIVGYPPEGGLLKSLLEDTRLYTDHKNNWRLMEPKQGHPYRFDLIWQAADEMIFSADGTVSIEALYQVWTAPPYGIKAGLLPFFATLFLLTRRSNVALYIDSVYRANFDDLFLDYLIKSPQSISVRSIVYNEDSRYFLELIKGNIRKLNDKNFIVDSHSSAFDIAKTLVGIVDNLNPWVHRTRMLTKNAIKVRTIIKNAHDPNKLLLDDLPETLKKKSEINSPKKRYAEIASEVGGAIEELVDAYPKLLHELRQLLFKELQLGDATEDKLVSLQNRAKAVNGVTGDFRIDALAARLSQFSFDESDIAGIASLAANKPISDWIDLDVERARQEIVALTNGFKRAELLTRVQGRNRNRHALSIIAATDDSDDIHELEFDLLEEEKKHVQHVKKKIHALFSNENLDERLSLGVISELASLLIVEFKKKKNIKVEVDKS